MAKKSKRGEHAVLYHRDSQGRGEQSPPKYVEWAQRESNKHGLEFYGTPEIMTKMIKEGLTNSGDLYLDYDVQGNIPVRTALTQLIKRLRDDQHVGHLFVHERARLSRPQYPEDGMRLETEIRRLGVTIHFYDSVAKPLNVGERSGIGDSIKALIEYEHAGKFRRDLSDKMLKAQLNLAEQGFSTGGRAPFFLERWLIDPNNKPVRPLQDGEIVRMRGHHVVWLPKNDGSLDLAIRIITMLEELPGSKVAKILTIEGIPSPDANRTRTDNGVKHRVSGAWHQTTIINTARSLYLVAKTAYGRRSMGDQLRFSKDGPREITNEDQRDDGNFKVVRNAEKEWISVPAFYEPIIDPDRIAKLVAVLDERAGTQRYKPRSRDEDNNPLGGGRVIDMECGWPMYREPVLVKRISSFRYKCGAYTQSSGALCNHNHVHGPTAAEMVLLAIRQKLLTPGIKERVQQKLSQMMAESKKEDRHANQKSKLTKELEHTQNKLAIVKRNVALAVNELQFHAVSEQLEFLDAQQKKIRMDIAAINAVEAKKMDVTDANNVLVLLDQAIRLQRESGNYRTMRELFSLVDARLYVRFLEVAWGKRLIRRPTGGILTFGSVKPPIEIYQGNTGRNAIKEAMKEKQSHQRGETVSSSADERESDSLGNVNRGDRI